MSESTKSLSERARTLPPAERLELVDDILGSLDETSPALDQLWAREAEDRLAAWRRGEIRAIQLDEVLRKYSHA
ncbi:MAG: addiction module protein [Rhodanobacteraceae bacterium]|nr:MAG: addiction module protein [Rhodanobacteraceae bacterium]